MGQRPRLPGPLAGNVHLDCFGLEWVCQRRALPWLRLRGLELEGWDSTPACPACTSLRVAWGRSLHCSQPLEGGGFTERGSWEGQVDSGHVGGGAEGHTPRL